MRAAKIKKGNFLNHRLLLRRFQLVAWSVLKWGVPPQSDAQSGFIFYTLIVIAIMGTMMIVKGYYLHRAQWRYYSTDWKKKVYLQFDSRSAL